MVESVRFRQTTLISLGWRGASQNCAQGEGKKADHIL